MQARTWVLKATAPANHAPFSANDLKAIDALIGRRVRDRRLDAALSQEDLSGYLGISFQQLQKYETGKNRISASRLYDIARFLSRPPGYFFEGLDNIDQINSETELVGTTISELLTDRRAVTLLIAFNELATNERKNDVINVVKAMAGGR